MAHQGRFRFELLSVDGKVVEDPEVKVIFRRKRDGREVFNAQLDSISRLDFHLPAYPIENFMQCEIEPSLFRRHVTSSFIVRNGEQVELEGDLVRGGGLVFLRSPDKWQAVFRSWNELAPGFGPLKQVLEESHGIEVAGGEGLERLTGDSYDSISAQQGADMAAILSKASLLNLFSRLSELKVWEGGADWFCFVDRILSIGRERIVAEVRPEMYDAVRKIRDDRLPGYDKALSEHHYDNFPTDVQVDKGSLRSVKSEHDKANLQVTVGEGVGGRFFLDADIDENGGLLEHFGDVLKHKFTGGTHPFDIHEYLVQQQPGLDLGYSLTIRD